VRQRGDESRDVQIPGADVVGAQGGMSFDPSYDKGKGKAVLTIGSDDEVSSDDDDPLQSRRRLLHNDGSIVGGLPSMGHQVLEMATMPQPNPTLAASSVAAPGGSSGSEPIASAVEVAGKEATTEKEVMDATAMKKATDDMAAVEKAAEEASKKTVEE
jgi:hypothetical protein